jgi:triosephosphate isomerase
MHFVEKFIALNLKAYPESAGEGGLRLSRLADEIAADTDAKIIVCPQPQQLELIARELKHATAFAQHADAVDAGAKTGWLPVESVKASGAQGTLVNHSEHRLKREEVEFVVEKAKLIGLRVMVCAADLDESLAFAVDLQPWAVAYEPPKLIGSGISVSTAQPEIVEKFVQRMGNEAPDVVPVVGAGVTTVADVKKCFELGADGVLLASAFVKSKDPAALLKEMAAQV